MKELFSKKKTIEKRLEVEVALAYGLSKAKIIEDWVPKRLEESMKEVTIERIDERDKELGHDIMALTVALAENSGEAGKYVHLGATSYDIVDTAWSLIMREATRTIKEKLIKIIRTLITYTLNNEDIIMVGRTHGQHALPITLGFKFANYVYELSRSLERLSDMEKRTIKGKIAGAVGTMAAWGDKGIEVEHETLKYLNLTPHKIATQIAPRDGFAEAIAVLAILGSQLDRFALEIRELMRPEIGEIAEGIGKKVGSSTMPQKRNPVTAEKISGLAKVLRAQVIIALENIPLWHERDLTNSSSERFLISHSYLIMDEMLESTIKLLENLVINPEKMRRNLLITKGAIMTENIMMKLVSKGIARDKAHKILREISKKAIAEDITIKEEILKDKRILKYLSQKEIDEALRPEKYLGQTERLIERTIKFAEEVINDQTNSSNI